MNTGTAKGVLTFGKPHWRQENSIADHTDQLFVNDVSSEPSRVVTHHAGRVTIWKSTSK